jgi:DNA-binding SARP family transcriptional activator
VVEFCVLGPLPVRVTTVPSASSAGRQQVLLAALLVRAGHVVSTDTLAGYLWDGAPPPSARATVQSYVMRLRRQLGPAAGACLTTKPSGYLMDVGEELDPHRFGRLERTGRQAAATGAWQLSRLCPPTSTASGRTRCLLTALYRSGRRVDALRTFTAVRNRLIEDIGVEPGPRLAELQASILADDPAPADNVLGESRPGLNLGVTSEPSVIARQLPGAVRHFTGRADELVRPDDRPTTRSAGGCGATSGTWP